MTAPRAVLFCAVNGIANCTNGVGRQTKTFLSALDRDYPRLAAAAGPFTPYLALPEPGPATWGYNTDDLAYATAIVQRHGGQVIALPYDTKKPMWRTAAWQQLCQNATDVLAQLAAVHDGVLAIAVDTPFAGLAHSRVPAGCQVLLALFSTAHITERPDPDPLRVAWERQAIDAVNRRPEVHVADVGSFLTRHLQQDYGLDRDRLLPWPSALHLAAPDLQPPTGAEAEAEVRRHRIPIDRPIVAAVGRTDHTKGIDLLIEALAPLREAIHLAAIAVPTDDDRARLLHTYRARCQELGLRSTIIGEYSRTLPRALAAFPATQVMAVPSRGETLANIVFETGLWARDEGAIVLAPGRDGFVEQITDGHNGLLYDPSSDSALTDGIRRALALTADQRARLRTAAYQRVQTQRDATRHLATLLRSVWPHPGTAVSRIGDYPEADARTPRSQAPTSTSDHLEAAG
ncbi:glycosyltransferase family 4 protein [Streptomyces sp. NPDC058471]|uniref:glycosyltransferase family 4 protein n=1 Tax=Streptomyces sp. NPDC058471 TaxID=3346516 RepID=UPI00365D7AE4